MRTAVVLLALLCASAVAQTPSSTATAPAQTPPSAATVPASTPDPSPSFEVATVKPSDPAACCARSFAPYGRRFASGNTTLRYLMQYAYSLQPRQIVGAPAWFDDARFDIAGEIDGQDQPTVQQWKTALQKLLTDRFQIKMHHESKELPAYVLTIAKSGSKLTKSDGDPNKVENTSFGGAVGSTMYGSGTNVTLGQFIGDLQRLALDRPVVDNTGLTGIYNLHLIFTREDQQSIGMGADTPAGAPPTIFTAIKDQLGLELKPGKAAVDVLVIDHVEKPSDN